ncbi:inosine/guanosine kinase [Gallaecimonas kandeliae]|uniref:inosine/guanosine kinase n=1 Tax=Gallaecimonas kandeliae TaxID=3029055 RepID=UPI0026496F89|nr:inosine/guanosine kinase [Gallaecimonas kandeliae]WKE64432.1 inosine/guanosine kinase [Gallaecimonas kandeliae]
MKFPGQRKSKHFFPVESRDPLLSELSPLNKPIASHICGIDQVLVDIEAHVPESFLAKYGLSKGHSMLIEPAKAEAIYKELTENDLIVSEYAGGTIGNTLHNYSVLSDDRSVLFGVMNESIRVGSSSYRYLCNTSSKVDLNYLQPAAGSIGQCITLIAPDGERSFAINKGVMNLLDVSHLDKTLIQTGSALVISAYLVRCDAHEPMKDTTMQAVAWAKEAGVPVVLTMGTKFIVEDRKDWWQQFIRDNVTVVAMNEDEALALTGHSDPLLACEQVLDWTDMVLCTAGPVGLYLAAHVEDDQKRDTSRQLLPGAIPEFNRFEFSRPMRKADCQQPVKVYTHISPYMGGPDRIKNTNGAGDGALAAVLHDMAANDYHRLNVPNSSKHVAQFLAYSSLSQVSKYANRVSYEVLVQHSPRLSRGLPEREDSLEEVYWDQ